MIYTYKSHYKQVVNEKINLLHNPFHKVLIKRLKLKNYYMFVVQIRY